MKEENKQTKKVEKKKKSTYKDNKKEELTSTSSHLYTCFKVNLETNKVPLQKISQLLEYID